MTSSALFLVCIWVHDGAHCSSSHDVFWVCWATWVSCGNSVHVFANSSHSSHIAGSWSSTLSSVNTALLNRFRDVISSLLSNFAINLLNLVLMGCKACQIWPELVVPHLSQFLSMSAYGGWLLRHISGCCMSRSCPSSCSLAHDTGIIQSATKTWLLWLNSEIWDVTHVTIVWVGGLTSFVFRRSKITSGKVHGALTARELRVSG